MRVQVMYLLGPSPKFLIGHILVFDFWVTCNFPRLKWCPLSPLTLLCKWILATFFFYFLKFHLALLWCFFAVSISVQLWYQDVHCVITKKWIVCVIQCSTCCIETFQDESRQYFVLCCFESLGCSRAVPSLPYVVDCGGLGGYFSVSCTNPSKHTHM